MLYKLKYTDFVYCVTYSLQHFVTEKRSILWQNGKGWDPEPKERYIKKQTVQSKLLRTLYAV
jgi:hypothetical protein